MSTVKSNRPPSSVGAVERDLLAGRHDAVVFELATVAVVDGREHARAGAEATAGGLPPVDLLDLVEDAVAVDVAPRVAGQVDSSS